MAARSTTWNSLRSESARVNGHSYEVTSVEVISKDALAKRAPALFAQDRAPAPRAGDL
jgi:hypothetical protein